MIVPYPTKESYRLDWQAAYTKDPPVPLNVDIELASTCNAKCSFCLYGDRDWFDGMKAHDWDGKPKKRFMPSKMAYRIIDECAELGVPALKMNFRGESTLHPKFTQIMAYAREARLHKCSCHTFGVHPISAKFLPHTPRYAFHDILINTNGNCPISSLPGLMSATKVMISLDSLDYGIYKKVRVGLNLDHAVSTVDWLVSHCHPNLWVRRVICKDNQKEDFVNKVKFKWPQGVKVSEHFAFDRNHYQNEAVNEIDFNNTPRKYCGYPSQRVVIEASGAYVPCCVAWDGEFKAGRWPELSIKDYWASLWRKNLVEELRQNVFKNDKCKNCTTFMAYDLPERAYVQDIEGKASIV